MMRTSLPLALYVHMPWCVRKCPYCDFNSHRAPSVLPAERYVDALLEDLDYDISQGALGGRELISVFMGGGTPSLFAPREVQRLLDGVHARVGCSTDLEVTLEANPGTIERGAFRDYRLAGVNRVSLGVQSFSDAALSRLGRIHSSGDVLAAVEELHAAGMDNFNLDLMYALPGQSLEGALADVATAVSLRPAHISHYELTLEPGTVFHAKPPELPSQEVAWEMQVACQEALAAAGYEQYEVSAYAGADRQCRHNLNYWSFGDYIGIGAGAHGKLTHGDRLIRTAREKQPARYLVASAAKRCSRIEVDVRERPFEFMLNALRLRRGFTPDEFLAGTGLDPAVIDPKLEVARHKGLLEKAEGAWRATDLGRRFLNDLLAMFLSDGDDGSVASA
jgi:putative oxygen-independent coproporphyrinogen III oxidase